MKTLTTLLTGISRNGKSICLVIAMFLLSISSFSQDPGGSPDGPPPAVPFEDNLKWILIAAGALLALFVIRRMQKRHVSNQ